MQPRDVSADNFNLDPIAEAGRRWRARPADLLFAHDGLECFLNPAGVAQLVEHQPSKLNVTSSSLVARCSDSGMHRTDPQELRSTFDRGFLRLPWARRTTSPTAVGFLELISCVRDLQLLEVPRDDVVAALTHNRGSTDVLFAEPDSEVHTPNTRNGPDVDLLGSRPTMTRRSTESAGSLGRTLSREERGMGGPAIPRVGRSRDLE